MKTLIKKNVYYDNSYGAHTYAYDGGGYTHGGIRLNFGSKFMGGVGVVGGGASAGSPASGTSDHIEYINIGTVGDAIDWGGELITATAYNMGVGGDGHKGLLSVGGQPSLTDMNFISFTSRGQCTDYGEQSSSTNNGQGSSNGHRGVWYDGGASTENNIYYVDFGTRGTAADFGGDRTVSSYGAACLSDGVRAVWNGTFTNTDVMDFINIAVSGSNAIDFGECLVDEHYKTGDSNGHRGLFSAGSPDDRVEYITIGTNCSGKDFGELSTGAVQPASVSDGSRCVVMNGFGTSDPMTSCFQNIGVAGGKAADFGSTTRHAYSTAGMSGD
tara:strand:+ start:71 stop:1054 length:984 start_codon:yes stop_codon:yes gene_type:complete